MTAILTPTEESTTHPSLGRTNHGRTANRSRQTTTSAGDGPSRCYTARPGAEDTGFDALYHRQYEPMVRLASGLVDRRAVAEEIVQDSFRQLWQRWDDVTTPKGYLRTSVVNGCHNELRRRRVRRDSWHKLISESDEAAGDYLADALADISKPRRQALVLRYYGGRTMNEIAETMGIPTGTAKSLIHRGLADLRGALY